MSTTRRHEKPLKRTNPSGKTVWRARITLRNGKRKTFGTYAQRGPCKTPGDGCCAQHAIDAAYDREYVSGRAPRQVGTVEAYRDHWERLHPRSRSTARTYRYNLTAALKVEVGGMELRSWRMDELERSEIAELAHHLLTVEGRAANGVRSVLQTLSAMWEDAITDGWTRHNPVAGLRVRSSDPRVRKPKRQTNVYSWEQMHGMADAAETVQARAMIRTLADTGMRLGEMLGLERADVDGDWLWVRRTAQNGSVTLGTKTTRDAPERARKCPLSPGLASVLRELPPRLDTRFLFATPRGRPVPNWLFYEWWHAAAGKAGLDGARPHDFRHSFVTLMRAAGVDPADLAAWTGHTVLTATATYTHSVGDSADLARKVAG